MKTKNVIAVAAVLVANAILVNVMMIKKTIKKNEFWCDKRLQSSLDKNGF